MKPSRRLLLVAVFFGLVTVMALNYYLQGLASGAQASAAAICTDVVVAKSAIPQHTRITAEMLAVESIPEDAVHPEAFKNIEEVAGSISRTEIIKGEQLLSARVAVEGEAGFSYRIPEKWRAVSLPANEVSGVSGFISPGDRVDVLVTYSDQEINDGVTITYTVIQNALILAAGEDTRKSEREEARLVSAITLAVTPRQAEVLAYALQKGYFYFALRSSLDEEIVQLDYYGAGNLETFRGR